MYILILVFTLIHIDINSTYFYLLFSLECIYCSRFCCFTTPIAMPNNYNALIWINHT